MSGISLSFSHQTPLDFIPSTLLSPHTTYFSLITPNYFLELKKGLNLSPCLLSFLSLPLQLSLSTLASASSLSDTKIFMLTNFMAKEIMLFLFIVALLNCSNSESLH